MNSKPNVFLLTFLFVILIAAFSFDFSSRGFLDSKKMTFQDSTPAMAESKEQEEPYQSSDFELEEKIVNVEEVNGYTIETYREYEIYKDEKGNVKQSIPTSNFNYIRYKN
ncbi:hypothetical protein QYG89_03585 [Bacillus sp. B190/17]|uniref:DUF3139 domain-containing protein n=1 Tax=Bacillus lumedeiriae TaxID=3058829 RepID=A0ABW8I5L1_9BACI